MRLPGLVPALATMVVNVAARVGAGATVVVVKVASGVGAGMVVVVANVDGIGAAVAATCGRRSRSRHGHRSRDCGRRSRCQPHRYHHHSATLTGTTIPAGHGGHISRWRWPCRHPARPASTAAGNFRRAASLPICTSAGSQHNSPDSTEDPSDALQGCSREAQEQILAQDGELEARIHHFESVFPSVCSREAQGQTHRQNVKLDAPTSQFGAVFPPACSRGAQGQTHPQNGEFETPNLSFWRCFHSRVFSGGLKTNSSFK
jgi:hypothetical protein